MELFILVVIIVVIGAFIGGVTNSIAIRMLFRPYKAIYVGSRRLPFTPGLIPKRRKEIAEQLGKIVVNHLLTTEGLQKKLESQRFTVELTAWLQKQATELINSEETPLSSVEKLLGAGVERERMKQFLSDWIDEKGEAVLAPLRLLPLAEIMPKSVDEKVESFLPKLTEMIVEKIVYYISSEEGTERLSNMVERFFHGRGKVGSMLAMFLGNDRLVDKLQPEVIKMLKDEGTNQLIAVFLRREWKKIKQLKVAEIEEQLQLKELVHNRKEKVIDKMLLASLEQPFSTWAGAYEKPIVHEAIPKLVHGFSQIIAKELATIFKKLHLEEIVKDQVEQFSLKHLEEIILSISGRELKLIIYLGALLGGVIGLFQAFLLIFLR